MKPEPVMKSKEAQTDSPDPLEIKMAEIMLMNEELQDQMRLKEESLDRLKYIIEQNDKERNKLQTQIKSMLETLEEYQYRVSEAELTAKRKTRTAHELTNDILNLQKQLLAKQKDLEHLEFQAKYIKEQKDKEIDELHKVIKRIEGELFSKNQRIKKLELDVAYLNELNQKEGSEGGKLVNFYIPVT